MYCDRPIMTEYKLCRKYAIANGYLSQSFFSEITLFTVHTLFLQDLFQAYPYFLSGLLIAVRWAFLIPILMLYSLFSVVLRPNAVVVSSFLKFLYHTQRRFTVDRTLLDECSSSSQRPLPDKTQYSQQTDIPASGGVRTQNISRRAAADLRLRSRDHWDRPSFPSLSKKKLRSRYTEIPFYFRFM